MKREGVRERKRVGHARELRIDEKGEGAWRKEGRLARN